MKIFFIASLCMLLASGCSREQAHISPVVRLQQQDLLDKGFENPWPLSASEITPALVRETIKAHDDFYFTHGELLEFGTIKESTDKNTFYFFFGLHKLRDGSSVKDVTVVYVFDRKSSKFIYWVNWP